MFFSNQLCIIFLLLNINHTLRINFPKNHVHNTYEYFANSHTKSSRLNKQHNYYNLEETKRVSNSRSIKNLNQCKDLCLEMYQIFPFQFKYHRLVYRQSEGDMKYVTGKCLYTFKLNSEENKNPENQNVKNIKAQISDKSQNLTQSTKKWYSWEKIKSFVDMSVVDDDVSKQQRKAWESYTKDCQDDSIKLSESSRIDLKLTIVHSDFQYYENQGFKNLQPFDDIDQLFSGLSLPQ